MKAYDDRMIAYIDSSIQQHMPQILEMIRTCMNGNGLMGGGNPFAGNHDLKSEIATTDDESA